MTGGGMLRARTDAHTQGSHRPRPKLPFLSAILTPPV